MSICLLFRIKLYRYSGYSAPPFEALWLDIGAGMCVSAAGFLFAFNLECQIPAIYSAQLVSQRVSAVGVCLHVGQESKGEQLADIFRAAEEILSPSDISTAPISGLCVCLRIAADTHRCVSDES